jgi:peptidoglycan/xylan/chitin deacetylase (PgdA/CDA1 family)
VLKSSTTHLVLVLLLLLVAGTVFPGSREFCQHHAKDSLDGSQKALQLLHAPRLAAVPPQVLAHGVRNEKPITLTFDACSARKPSQYDERVTQVLLDTHTPATIFLGSKWMEEEPEQVKVPASRPEFALANHSCLHPHMTTLSEDRIAEELQRTHDMLYMLTGVQATLFRPPRVGRTMTGWLRSQR